jgi:IS5 family transposase
MLLLQTGHHLPDERIAKALTRNLSLIHFCSFSLEGRQPDASTLCRFRNGLVKHDLFDSLLRVVHQSLEVNGFTLAQSKYIFSDATLIASTRRPKRVLQGQKTASGHYKMIDEAGLLESVSPLPANGSAMTRLEAVLSRAPRVPGQTLLYNNCVDSAANRQHLKARGLKDGIMRKQPKGQAMAD